MSHSSIILVLLLIASALASAAQDQKDCLAEKFSTAAFITQSTSNRKTAIPQWLFDRPGKRMRIDMISMSSSDGSSSTKLFDIEDPPSKDDGDKVRRVTLLYRWDLKTMFAFPTAGEKASNGPSWCRSFELSKDAPSQMCLPEESKKMKTVHIGHKLPVDLFGYKFKHDDSDRNSLNAAKSLKKHHKCSKGAMAFAVDRNDAGEIAPVMNALHCKVKGRVLPHSSIDMQTLFAEYSPNAEMKDEQFEVPDECKKQMEASKRHRSLRQSPVASNALRSLTLRAALGHHVDENLLDMLRLDDDVFE